MPVPPKITIDGPVASGKTVVGRCLARRLGYRFYDTGATYRAFTWVALSQGIEPTDHGRLAALASRLKIEVRIAATGDERWFVDNKEVTALLRDPRVEENVSLVATVAGVRDALVREQRKVARGGKIVMAGRDIGTVVLPDTKLKLFLTASPEERARRRYEELRNSGRAKGYNEIIQEIMKRDKIDTERSHSPLRPAADAHVVDTEGLGIKEVVEEIMALVEKA